MKNTVSRGGYQALPSALPRSLSIVLPAHNEEGNIAQAIGGACSIARELAPAWEIIVVDDGSTDETARVVAEIARESPQVRLIRFAANQGYGAALRAGFAATRGDLVFYTDSDLQFDVSDLRYMLPLLNNSDVVVGFRVYRYDAVLRCMASWVYNRLVRVLFRVKVRDVDCSFKLFRRGFFEVVDLETSDFFIDTEIVAKARRWNFRIVEKGVRHYPRRAGESSVRTSHVLQTLRTIARMWIRIYFPVLGRTKAPAAPVCTHPHEAIPIHVARHNGNGSHQRAPKEMAAGLRVS